MLNYDDFKNKLQRVHDYGRYLTALCPFHEEHGNPSLMIFRDGWFRCLSANCNRNGSWKQLWNKLNGQPIQIHPETRTMFRSPVPGIEFTGLAELCYQAHIDLGQFSTWQWYMEQRGLEDAIEIAEIGYYRGWYTIPVFDRDHNFVTAVFRAAPHVQEVTGLRYWCSHKPTMYVPDWNLLLHEPKFIVVVFGMLDALTVNKFRYPVVTVTAGANQFDAAWLDEFRRPIYIIPDKKEESTALKLAGDLGWRGHVVTLDFPEGCKDVNDYLQQGKSKELEVALLKLDR